MCGYHSAAIIIINVKMEVVGAKLGNYVSRIGRLSNGEIVALTIPFFSICLIEVDMAALNKYRF